MSERDRCKSRRLAHPVVGALVLLAVGAAAYANSLWTPMFHYDCVESILENPHIRTLWPLSEALSLAMWDEAATVSARPLLSLSFALNYAVHGLDVFGYHAVNVGLHILNAWLVFGIVRRLVARRYKAGHWARGLPLPVALLWVVHPINTQAVTYVAQRAELLLGLLFLASLYAAIRYFDAKEASHGGRVRCWLALAVFSSLLGVVAKESIVALPLVVLAYDRVFVSPTLAAAMRAHGKLYAGLLLSWVALAFSVAAMSASIERNVAAFGPPRYLISQPAVILRYVRLLLWPTGLVWDYAWMPASGILDTLVSFSVVAVCGMAGLWLAVRRHAVGFALVAAFLTLAPTSSFMPTLDLIAEHRMYLPSIACLSLGVAAVGYGLRFLRDRPLRRAVASAVATAVSAAFLLLTVRRNEDYRSAVVFWEDNVAKQPESVSAKRALVRAYNEAGRDEAEFETLLRMYREHPASYIAQYEAGVGLFAHGREREAMDALQNAYELERRPAPLFAVAQILARHGCEAAAAARLRAVIEMAEQEGMAALREDASALLRSLDKARVSGGDATP